MGAVLRYQLQSVMSLMSAEEDVCTIAVRFVRFSRGGISSLEHLMARSFRIA